MEHFTYFKEKIELMKKHAEWLIEHKGETVGCREIRKHLLKYFKEYPHAKSIRKKVCTVDSLANINRILKESIELVEGPPN